MVQNSTTVKTELQGQILAFCRHIAGPFKMLAVCQSEDYTIQTSSAKSTIEVILVLKDFQPRLLSYTRIIDGRNVVFFAVDKWVFERDVDRSFLGEALGSLLILPYLAISNGEYFHNQEIELKKRLVLELLENLVLNYPELSYRMRIKPQYFMYEIILNRIRVFPPTTYGASCFLRGEADAKKVSLVLDGYLQALYQLETEGFVSSSDGCIMLSKKFIYQSKNARVRLTNTLKSAPRALFASFFGVFPQMLNFLSQNSETLMHFQAPPWKKGFAFGQKIMDPQKYVLMPTADGWVSLADKLDIRRFATKYLSTEGYDRVKVEEFGGVLNDVYLLRICKANSERKILIKRFKDLSSLKWFPLSMWSLGARSFALLGRSRLERECAINELLYKAGFSVPKILHVSANERLIFMEFLEGENLGYYIKRLGLKPNNANIQVELANVEKVGEIYAKVHALNVVLGDTKPENVMVGRQSELSLLDFEQATRNGDKSWDVACFLYYCGHYMPLNGERKAEAIAKAFIRGYLKAGGSPTVIKCAGITKYTRVFSVFALPAILRVMSNTCKTIESK